MPPLRNFDRAVVDERKFVEYALDPTNERGAHKAYVFSSVLGFTKDNWESLKTEVLNGVAVADAEFVWSEWYGDVYYVDLTITGPSGRTAVVRTTWQYDKQSDGSLAENPRLVTLFVR